MRQLISFLLLFSICYGNEPFCYFMAPKKWDITDPRHLASHVKIGFIGKGKKGFNPSLNLASEKVSLTLTEYVKKVKSIHEADRNNRWRDLGKFTTAAGEARLTSIESTTEWGPTRLLQLLLVKDGQAYILTGCAAKEEFSDYYGEFQNAFRSLQILSHPLDSLTPQKKEQLEKLTSQEPKDWPLIQKVITEDFSDMGACWQIFTLKLLMEKT
jgi:hypothetical protein